MSGPGTPDGRPQHLVVMGVSGVGKSTIAEGLSTRLGYAFAEGDDFHPQANIDKMSAGAPLDDEDRMPWLRRLAQWTRARDDEGTSTVVTCSALRRRYRDVLRSGAADTFFVHLVGDQRVLLERMGRRQHFMPPALLKSQFDTLEPLGKDEHGLSVDVSESPERIVQQVVQSLRLRPRRPSGVDGQ